MDTNLKALRKKKKLTQREAASYLRMPLRQYRKNERNKNDESDSVQQVMAKRLMALNPTKDFPNLPSLDDIHSACGKVFEQYNIEYAYLFGPYAKGTATEGSYIEILISSKFNERPVFGLNNMIRKELGDKVVLLSVDQIIGNKPLLNRILREGKKVY